MSRLPEILALPAEQLQPFAWRHRDLLAARVHKPGSRALRNPEPSGGVPSPNRPLLQRIGRALDTPVPARIAAEEDPVHLLRQLPALWPPSRTRRIQAALALPAGDPEAGRLAESRAAP